MPNIGIVKTCVSMILRY